VPIWRYQQLTASWPPILQVDRYADMQLVLSTPPIGPSWGSPQQQANGCLTQPQPHKPHMQPQPQQHMQHQASNGRVAKVIGAFALVGCVAVAVANMAMRPSGAIEVDSSTATSAEAPTAVPRAEPMATPTAAPTSNSSWMDSSMSGTTPKNGDFGRNVDHKAVKKACPSSLPKDARLILTSTVLAYHGSTALMQLLMSSRKVSTPCRGQTWQCESSRKKRKIKDNKKKNRTEIRKEQNEPTVQWLSDFWDLSKPVLFSKMFDLDARSFDQSIDPMPSKMVNHGIRHLQRAFVFMWTPICVRALTMSHHPHIENEAEEQLRLVSLLKMYTSAGWPVLVISYADLLWKTDDTKKRLETFLPCVGSLDVGFIPKKGVDIFPANKFKTTGTIKSFGRKTDPWECCGYRLKTSRCESQKLFKMIPVSQQNQFAAGQKHLLSLSTVD